MTEKMVVCNIQRFCLHDGPGIRTTVFFKGCSIRCPWCANPECISADIEEYVTADNQTGIYGEYMSCDDIYNTLIKDKMYYDENGGVTFSGGEALLNAYKMEPLLKRLKESQIHLCLETALFVPKNVLASAVKYFDYIIADIKILDKDMCKQILGGNIDVYVDNLLMLNEVGKKFMLRLPLIKPFTTGMGNIKMICELIVQHNIKPEKIELIHGHNLAEKKYVSLGKKMYYCEIISEKECLQIKDMFETIGLQVEVKRI